MENMIGLLQWSLLPFIAAFAVTAASGAVLIPWLRRLKFGQEIREEGPDWHKKKSGTPTMGGIMFIAGTGIAVIITSVLLVLRKNLDTTAAKGIVIFAVSMCFGLVGFIDDYIKVVKKRNLGLTPVQKLALQLFFAVVYAAAMYFMGAMNTTLLIPFTSFTINLPIWLYIPFLLFVVVGVVNAVNLTDGLDGLATSITTVVAVFFAIVSFICFKEYGNTIFAAALAGGLIGFFLFNHYPAKVFMGDTGSLFLGAAVALMAVDLGMMIFLILIGFVYFCETLSVILQTTYFKYTKRKFGEGKRIFKMTPIHHHFEMCGWSEWKIVGVFTAVTAVMCILSWFGIVL